MTTSDNDEGRGSRRTHLVAGMFFWLHFFALLLMFIHSDYLYDTGTATPHDDCHRRLPSTTATTTFTLPRHRQRLQATILVGSDRAIRAIVTTIGDILEGCGGYWRECVLLFIF